MNGEIKQTRDLFEIWDGGHCYFRARRSIQPMLKGGIEMDRMPSVLMPEEIASFSVWASDLDNCEVREGREL